MKRISAASILFYYTTFSITYLLYSERQKLPLHYLFPFPLSEQVIFLNLIYNISILLFLDYLLTIISIEQQKWKKESEFINCFIFVMIVGASLLEYGFEGIGVREARTQVSIFLGLTYVKIVAKHLFEKLYKVTSDFYDGCSLTLLVIILTCVREEKKICDNVSFILNQ